MIDIKNLRTKDIGKGVVYFERINGERIPAEHGIINSWNEKYVFVRYWGKAIQNYQETAQATDPRDLEWRE